jgi:hypothetical protein
MNLGEIAKANKRTTEESKTLKSLIAIIEFRMFSPTNKFNVR